MSTKDFLKPTKGKVVVFLLIFFFTIYLRGAATKLETELLKDIEIVFSPHYLLYKYISPPRSAGQDITFDYQTIFLILLIFIIGIAYWYLLSCLIIFVYQKIKERMRKK